MKNLMKPENEAEANLIKSVLEEHGIYVEIKENGGRATEIC